MCNITLWMTYIKYQEQIGREMSLILSAECEMTSKAGMFSLTTEPRCSGGSSPVQYSSVNMNKKYM